MSSPDFRPCGVAQAPIKFSDLCVIVERNGVAWHMSRVGGGRYFTLKSTRHFIGLGKLHINIAAVPDFYLYDIAHKVPFRWGRSAWHEVLGCWVNVFNILDNLRHVISFELVGAAWQSLQHHAAIPFQGNGGVTHFALCRFAVMPVADQVHFAAMAAFSALVHVEHLCEQTIKSDTMRSTKSTT